MAAMGAEFAVGLLLDELTRRVKGFVEGRSAADSKTGELRRRLRGLHRALLALKEHVEPTHQEVLEETEEVVDRATSTIVKWESKGSMRKRLDGAGYAKNFESIRQDLEARIQDLTLAVGVACRRKLSSIAARIDNGPQRQFEFDPADPPDERASRLGSGSFGRTHCVVDRVIKVKYAMKIIDVRAAAEKGVNVESMHNEAKMMQTLSHPNIVGYNCCFEYGHDFCIVMEFADGGHLGEQIGKRHDAATPRLWIKQTCEPLAYMHGLRVLHRDVKPENILLSGARKTVKLADLGLSSIIASTSAAAQTKVGTDLYMGPERAFGGKYGTSEDMWAVGCIATELLTQTALHARCPAGKFFCLDGQLVKRVVEASIAVDPLLGGVARDLLELDARRRLSAAEAVVRLGGRRPSPGPTKPPPGPSDEDDDDDTAATLVEHEERRRQEQLVAAARRKAADAEREKRAMEAKLEHEKALAEEQRKADEAQAHVENLRRRELELQLQRALRVYSSFSHLDAGEREAEGQARKKAEERRKSREADEALAKQVAEAKARRLRAEAEAEAERKLVDDRRRAAAPPPPPGRLLAMFKKAPVPVVFGARSCGPAPPPPPEEVLAMVKKAGACLWCSIMWRLGSLDPLATLTGLTTLDLSKLKFDEDKLLVTGDLGPLRRLTRLMSLNLNMCINLQGDLEPLRSLVQLKELNLSSAGRNRMKFTGTLEPLRALKQLQILNVFGCYQLQGTLEPLRALEQLRVLGLGWCRQLHGTLEPLQPLEQLQNLDLCDCRQLQGTLEPLRTLEQLQKLGLRECSKLQCALEPLRSLEQLQIRNVYDCGQLRGAKYAADFIGD